MSNNSFEQSFPVVFFIYRPSLHDLKTTVILFEDCETSVSSTQEQLARLCPKVKG